MRVQLKLVLDCPPDAAWRALRSPAVFAEVSQPLVAFEPEGEGGLPRYWPEGRHPLKVSAIWGIIPLGSQDLDLSYRQRGAVRVMEDAGGPTDAALTVITRWRHRMAIAPGPDGKTLYRDRLEIGAGLLTPVVWAALWAFWQWRGGRLVKIAPTFADRFRNE